MRQSLGSILERALERKDGSVVFGVSLGFSLDSIFLESKKAFSAIFLLEKLYNIFFAQDGGQLEL